MILEAQRKASQNEPPKQDIGSSWWKRIRVDFIAGLLVAGVVGVVAYLSLEGRYDREVEKNSVLKAMIDTLTKERDQAKEERQNALTQQAILKHLGPNVLSFQRLTVGQSGMATQIHLGQCPDSPCYTVKYDGVKIDNKYGDTLQWVLSGEGQIENSIVKMEHNRLHFPAQVLCYGRIPITSNHTIMLILERIINLNTFDITVGLMNTPSPAPSSPTQFDLGGYSGCFKE